MRTPRTTSRRACVTVLAALASCAVGSIGEADAGRVGHRVLKKGMRGRDVSGLQRDIRTLGAQVVPDGRFGPATARAIRELETRFHWRMDGRVQRWEAKRIGSRARVKRSRARSAWRSGSYVFPLAASHSFGGPANRFGAGRAGHRHQGQDIFARCGSPVVAALTGIVRRRAYQATGAGHYVVVRGFDGTDTVYDHLRRPSWAGPRTRLTSGQQLGQVGHTGSATGCHLHFEHWARPGWYTGGGPFDPLAELLVWDAYS